MPLSLFEETTALLAELERRGVPYAVAGALALAIHGVPRATTDIDLLVRREALQAALAVASARRLRRPGPADAVQRRARGAAYCQDRGGRDAHARPPSRQRETSSPCGRGRERVLTGGGDVWVVSRAGLIEMKAWAGREQDLADIRRLRELDR